MDTIPNPWRWNSMSTNMALLVIFFASISFTLFYSFGVMWLRKLLDVPDSKAAAGALPLLFFYLGNTIAELIVSLLCAYLLYKYYVDTLVSSSEESRLRYASPTPAQLAPSAALFPEQPVRAGSAAKRRK